MIFFIEFNLQHLVDHRIHNEFEYHDQKIQDLVDAIVHET